MKGGPGFWKGAVVWLVVLGMSVMASAQDSSLQTYAGPYPTARPLQENTSPYDGTFYFGIMGQVARPGVYELSTPRPQLLDLIRQAGGLTQQATNQLRIVRQGNAGQSTVYMPTLVYSLIPGDIVVADGPLLPRSSPRYSDAENTSSEIQTAYFVEPSSQDLSGSCFPVALMNLVDRPVILPVPESHANVSAVLSYLGQDVKLAPQVKVLPVGRVRSATVDDSGAPAFFAGPTVLYFNPRFIHRAHLPKLPDVYRVESLTLAPSTIGNEAITSPSANASVLPMLPAPALSPLSMLTPPRESFPRPLPHSEVTLPDALHTDSPEPPMIAKFRDLERQIPTPSAVQPNPVPKPLLPTPTPVSAEEIDRAQAEKSNSSPTRSWWAYVGLALLGLGAWGIFTKLSMRKPTPVASDLEEFVPILPDEPEPVRRSQAAPKEPAAAGGNSSPADDILFALVYNQLPILEEAPQPAPSNEKPISRKTLRWDPSEGVQTTPVKKPKFASRPQPKSEAPQPSQSHSEEDTSRQTVSLLDRVLQRANERRGLILIDRDFQRKTKP